MKDYVETNIGCIPLEEYKEIVAMQHGFDSYEDLLCAGYRIELDVRCNRVQAP